MTINISFHENNSWNTIFSAFKTEPFHVDLLCLLFLITFIALVCTIFAEDRRHSAMSKQAFVALVCTVVTKSNSP